MWPPGLTKFAKELRQPQERVFFAGADVARLWVSFIDGTIESGVRSARDAAAYCS